MTRERNCVETLCLGQLANLDQLEQPWFDLLETRAPELTATALRLFLTHLDHTISMTQRAAVISAAEESLSDQTFSTTADTVFPVT